MIEKFEARPMDTDWAVYVGYMLEKRLQLEAVAPAMYPARFAGAGNPAAIFTAEARLGFELDGQHKEILLEQDGWPDGFADGDLLSTAQLGHGAEWAKGLRIIDSAYESPLVDEDLPPREALYPIHVGGNYSPTAFVLDRSGLVSFGGHPVIWLGEDEIRGWWPNCFEFWLGCYTMQSTTYDELVSVRHAGELPADSWENPPQQSPYSMSTPNPTGPVEPGW